MQNVKQL